jgi:hypothetical protein
MLKRLKDNKKISERFNTVFKIKKKSNLNIKHENILFCPINASVSNTYKEALLASFCAIENANVSFLYQNTIPPFLWGTSKSLMNLNYIFKVRLNIKFIKSLNLRTIKIKQIKDNKSSEIFKALLEDKENFANYKYKGIQIGDLVLADTIRYFMCTGPLWEDKKFIKLLEKTFVFAIGLCNAYETQLKKERPDKLVMSHAIYVFWGLLFRVARNMDIPVDVYNGSYRKDTIRFYHNEPNAPMPMYEWEKVKDIELSENEVEIVDEYFLSREDQKLDNVVLFDNTKSIYEKELNTFIKTAKDNNQKICTLFANIAWDAYAFSSTAVFEDMSEWIIENINFFIENKEHCLIVKAHPAEAFFNVPDQYRVKSLVERMDLPTNIMFLNENSNIKPFDLYPITDIGLVNISTVAVELALLNKTALTSGAGGQYSDKGFTIDPKSKKDYFVKLSNLLSDDLEFSPNISIAKRYLFFRFFKEALNFDLFKSPKYNSIEDLNFVDEKQFFEDNSMRVILEGILNDKPFLLETTDIKL